MHNRGYDVFPSKIFCLTVPKIFVGITSMFRKFSWSKNFMHYRRFHVFLSKILCLTVRKIFVNESSVFDRNSRFETILRIKKGYHIFPLKNFGSRAKKNFWASLQCFRKIVVSGKLMHIRWITFFCGKFQVWQCQKKRSHPFNFSEIWGNRKILCIIRVSQFPAENCFSHSAENFCKESSYFWEKFSFRKVFTDEGGGGSHDISPLKKMVSQCRKICEHPCNNSEKLSYRKKICRKGSITFFCRKLQVWQCRKNSWASLQGFINFGVIELFYAK